MRYSHSPDFGVALRAHQDAYAAYDVLAEAGADGTPEYESTCAAERAALDAMMLMPAQCPGDVAAKFKLFIDQDMATWSEAGTPNVFAERIALDLADLNRPCVSGQMAAAFAIWADTWVAMQDAAYDTDGDNAGNLPIAVTDAESTAQAALYAMPCAAPGDYVVKLYLDQMLDEGGYPHGYPFMIKEWIEGANPGLRDLQDCDLGRCMLALGRTDFDPKAWLDGMEQSGGPNAVTILPQRDGSLMFGICEPRFIDSAGGEHGEPYQGAFARYRLLQQIINGGYENTRRQQVIDYIGEQRPDLVFGKAA